MDLATAYQRFQFNRASVIIEFRFDITPNDHGHVWAQKKFANCFDVTDNPQSVTVDNYACRASPTVGVNSSKIANFGEFARTIEEQIAQFSRDVFIAAKKCSIRGYKEHINVKMVSESLLVCNIFCQDSSREIAVLQSVAEFSNSAETRWQGREYNIREELEEYLKRFAATLAQNNRFEKDMQDFILLLKHHWNLCRTMPK